jgi:hypothetical protein
MKHVHTLAVAVLLLAAGGASYFSGVPVSKRLSRTHQIVAFPRSLGIFLKSQHQLLSSVMRTG